jgi:hypothetical protein
MTKAALLRLWLKKRNEAACRLGVTYPQFLGFLLLPPSQAHAGPSSVLVDELDAGGFEGF